MGKCVSKHPSMLTIAISERDLVNANHIWTTYAAAHNGEEYLMVVGAEQPIPPRPNDCDDSEAIAVQSCIRAQLNDVATATTADAPDEVSTANELVQQLNEESHELAVILKTTARDICVSSSVNIGNDRTSTETGRTVPQHQSLQSFDTNGNCNAGCSSDANNNTHNTNHQANCECSSGPRQRHDNHLEYDKTLPLANACEPQDSGEQLSRPSNATTAQGHSVARLFQACINNEFQGQTESKKSSNGSNSSSSSSNNNNKSSKGGTAMETKGTAMSFGFRKKIAATPKKLKKLIEGDTKSNNNDNAAAAADKCNNPRHSSSSTEFDTSEGDGNGAAKSSCSDTSVTADDPNGNGVAGFVPKVTFERMGAAAAAKALPATRSATSTNASPVASSTSLKAVASNRFGFRARPASAGIVNTTSSSSSSSNRNGVESILNNNNNSNSNDNDNVASSSGSARRGSNSGILVNTLRRRSKSANTTVGALTAATGDGGTARVNPPKTITFNLQQNSTIEIQRRQFFEPPVASPSQAVSLLANGRQTYGSASSTALVRLPRNSFGPSIINSGLHTNMIDSSVRPTPRNPATPYSKFTLQTMSLPKPEFAIPISVSATTPTTPSASSPLSMALLGFTTAHSSTGGGSYSGGTRCRGIIAQTFTQPAYGSYTISPPPVYNEPMDAKTAKQAANTSRRGFNGSREISADSGIASLDTAGDSSTSSSASTSAAAAMRNSSPTYRRSNSRPRNLQMIMNGRHKFEVRDIETVATVPNQHNNNSSSSSASASTTNEEDPSSESTSSLVEPLALPKLPSDQTVPLPLSGLVRSNTVLSRESYELKNAASQHGTNGGGQKLESRPHEHPSEENDSFYEEKAYLDHSTSEKSHRKPVDATCSSKTSSPGSSMMSSWCNAAGESLAVKDCSSLTVSSADDKSQSPDDTDNQHVRCDKPNPKKTRRARGDNDEATDNCNIDSPTASTCTDDYFSDSISLNGCLTASLSAPHLPARKRKPIAQDGLSVRSNPPPISDTNWDGNSSGDRDTGDEDGELKPQRPRSLLNMINASRFAAMALEGSVVLLEDETSPTDSLMSNTESDDAAQKERKHKLNEELQEKDIDEISPELEMTSPISPGSPTHASHSHSLSLSDCGNLIDDEIADQPALLFNAEDHNTELSSLCGGGGRGSGSLRRDKTDTPTLMETISAASLHSTVSVNRTRNALQQAIELSLRTPLAVRRAVMERAESLDTLSPCESICSDDLMMDFELNSSMDSIRSSSNRSRSGSDLHRLDDTDRQSMESGANPAADLRRGLATFLRSRNNNNNNSSEKDNVITHLPARATRLLNRSRLQQQCPLNNASGRSSSPAAGLPNDSTPDSPRSVHSLRRTSSRASSVSGGQTGQAGATHGGAAATPMASDSPRSIRSTRSTHSIQSQQSQHSLHSQHSQHSTSSAGQKKKPVDDSMIYDKSFRNAMIQDVLQFKRQLLRLRRILQEADIINPFDPNNAKLLGFDTNDDEDAELLSLAASLCEDPVHELNDLRRQVVYLQGQVEQHERTIEMQRQQIDQFESGDDLSQRLKQNRECVHIATQTERTRPLNSSTIEGLSRSKPEYTSYTTHFPVDICHDSVAATAILRRHQNHHLQQQQQQHGQMALPSNQTRRHTIISTTLTNYNHQSVGSSNSNSTNGVMPAPRRASIAWERQQQQQQQQQQPQQKADHSNSTASVYKPVRITIIGEPLKQWQSLGTVNAAISCDMHANGNGNGNASDMLRCPKEFEFTKNLMNSCSSSCGSSSSSSSSTSSCSSGCSNNCNDKAHLVNGNCKIKTNHNNNNNNNNNTNNTNGNTMYNNNSNNNIYQCKAKNGVSSSPNVATATNLNATVTIV